MSLISLWSLLWASTGHLGCQNLSTGLLRCQHFFSIPAAFSLQVIFLLDLAFETLRLFENVTFATAEPGITLVCVFDFLPS